MTTYDTPLKRAAAMANAHGDGDVVTALLQHAEVYAAVQNDRDHYKARAEALLKMLEALADEWYGLWVGSHEKFSPPEIAHAKRVEYQARALITRINQEDSERAR